MIRPCLALASQTLVATLRSRVASGVFLLLAIATILLPNAIQGDGTQLGQLKIFMTYALGLIVVTLSVFSVLLGCVSACMDIKERQIDLLISKPVHPFQIWLGKWIGIGAILLLMVSLLAALAFATIQMKMNDQELSDATRSELFQHIGVSKSILLPQEFLHTSNARPPSEWNPFPRLAVNNKVPLTPPLTVPPGGVLHRTFYSSPPPTEAAALLLRYKVSTAHAGPTPLKTVWHVGPAREESVFVIRQQAASGRESTLPLSREAMDDRGTVWVSLHNVTEPPIPLYFLSNTDLVLEVGASRFGVTLGKAFLVIFFKLMFYAGLGLTAGYLFSIPVAGLVSLVIVLIFQMDSYIHTLASHGVFGELSGSEAHRSFLAWPLRILYKCLDAVVEPIPEVSPVSLLTSGLHFSWHWVTWTLFLYLIVYGLGLGILGAEIIKRREMGLTLN